MSQATKYHKLTQLLDQTAVYSNFIASKIQVAKGKAGEKAKEETSGKNGDHAAASTNFDYDKLLGGNCKLRDYQKAGVDWLVSLDNNGLNGILADEMGLGKTIQVISYIAYLWNVQTYGPYIVVAPLSTLHGWGKEFAKWAPHIPMQVYHGSKQERKAMRANWRGKCCARTPVLLTSYEIAMADKSELKPIKWKLMVVDEGHRLKNFECKLILTLKEYSTGSRLLLTGTPLQNNLTELWSLLNFLLPEIFDSLNRFQSWFDFDTDTIQDKKGRQELVAKERSNQILSKLHDVLRPFVLRRLKKDVLTLQPKQEYVVYTPVTPVQRRMYESILNGTIGNVLGPNTGTLNNMLMQLRKVCNHPFLLQEPTMEEGTHTDERIVSSSGKLLLLDALLSKLEKGGHKVLIFSQMTRMLDIIQDFLSYRGYDGRFCRIDGGVPAKERQVQIDAFQTDPRLFCFLLSTRAGGLGINLTAADTVIIYDSDWNPHQDMQAQDRCHRFGQKRDVLIWRFLTPNSVEVNMLQKASSKRALEDLVITKGNLKGIHTKRKAENGGIVAELLEMFQKDDYDDDDSQTDDATKKAEGKTDNGNGKLAIQNDGNAENPGQGKKPETGEEESNGRGGKGEEVNTSTDNQTAKPTDTNTPHTKTAPHTPKPPADTDTRTSGNSSSDESDEDTPLMSLSTKTKSTDNSKTTTKRKRKGRTPVAKRPKSAGTPVRRSSRKTRTRRNMNEDLAPITHTQTKLGFKRISPPQHHTTTTTSSTTTTTPTHTPHLELPSVTPKTVKKHKCMAVTKGPFVNGRLSDEVVDLLLTRGKIAPPGPGYKVVSADIVTLF